MTRVDVVVPTYGRPAGLHRCLSGLGRQTFTDFRVIVVDDCSPEPPDSIVEAAAANRLPVEMVRTAVNGGPARGRNLGAAMGDAEFILFVDDDVDPAPNLIASHLGVAADADEHTVVIGPLLAPEHWKPTPWNDWEARGLAVEYRRMMAGTYAPTWRQLFTANAMLRRSDYVRVGGFNPQFTRAEDIELGLRLAKSGCSFVFNPEGIVWHHARRTLASWRSIPNQYARFDLLIDSLHPEIGWLDLLAEEKAKRNGLTREAVRLAGRIGCERVFASAAIGIGSVSHRLGLAAPAMAAFSLAFELLYARGFRDEVQGRDDTGDWQSPGQRLTAAP